MVKIIGSVLAILLLLLLGVLFAAALVWAILAIAENIIDLLREIRE